MELKYSDHSLKGHEYDKWNARTIRPLIENSILSNMEILDGDTSDCICGYAPDNRYVGVIVSKERNGVQIIITGFEAPREYWLEV